MKKLFVVLALFALGCGGGGGGGSDAGEHLNYRGNWTGNLSMAKNSCGSNVPSSLAANFTIPDDATYSSQSVLFDFGGQQMTCFVDSSNSLHAITNSEIHLTNYSVQQDCSSIWTIDTYPIYSTQNRVNADIALHLNCPGNTGCDVTYTGDLTRPLADLMPGN